MDSVFFVDEEDFGTTRGLIWTRIGFQYRVIWWHRRRHGCQVHVFQTNLYSLYSCGHTLPQTSENKLTKGNQSSQQIDLCYRSSRLWGLAPRAHQIYPLGKYKEYIQKYPHFLHAHVTMKVTIFSYIFVTCSFTRNRDKVRVDQTTHSQHTSLLVTLFLRVSLRIFHTNQLLSHLAN